MSNDCSLPAMVVAGCTQLPKPMVQPNLLHDPRVPHAGLDTAEGVSTTLAACVSMVQQIRNSCPFPARLHSIHDTFV